jgi:phospholipase/carboxylesterase
MDINVFRHIFTRGTSARTLLLLHGTGGDETSLLKLGEMLDPAANILSPKGNVMEGPMPRFFRRLAEGVFDIPDLIARTNELADWIALASTHYNFDRNNLLAVGYSNGANIAANMLLQRAGTIQNAILLRPMMLPLPSTPVDLSNVRVLISAGQRDPITPVTGAKTLAAALQRFGASVTTSIDSGDHALTQQAIESAREFCNAQI